MISNVSPPLWGVSASDLYYQEFSPPYWKLLHKSTWTNQQLEPSDIAQKENELEMKWSYLDSGRRNNVRRQDYTWHHCRSGLGIKNIIQKVWIWWIEWNMVNRILNRFMNWVNPSMSGIHCTSPCASRCYRNDNELLRVTLRDTATRYVIHDHTLYLVSALVITRRTSRR